MAVLASEIKLAEAKIARLSRRIADEDSNDEVYKLLKGELDRLVLEKRLKQEQLAQLKHKNAGDEQRSSPTEEIETALTVIEQLQEVVSTNKEAVQRFQDLLVSLDIRIGLNFGNNPVGKRILRNLLGGIIAIGGHQLPVPIYGRNNLNAVGRTRLLATNTTNGEASPPGDEGSATPSIVNPSQREDNLLPKVLHGGA